MNRNLTGALALALTLAAPAAFAAAETEPNDSKAQANLMTLPAASATGVITGNSVSGTTTGLDYFLVRTAAQAAPGWYRHRLIITTTGTAGHTGTIRGLTQTAGVINAGTDISFQTSSTGTTPARFNEFYTSEASADVYYRVTGTASTTADYSVDYEVQPVTVLTGPTNLDAATPITITTVGQGHTTDTDLWVYDASRVAIPGFGNDDEPTPSTALQSRLTRTFTVGSYFLALTNFAFANNLASPPDDRFLTGNVLDFPGVAANSSTATGLNVAVSIGGTAVPATKANPYEVVFVSFAVPTPVEIQSFTAD